MPKFTIDKIEYHTEDLTEHGEKLYQSLQFSMRELKKIESELEVYKTAHKAFTKEFRSELTNKK